MNRDLPHRGHNYMCTELYFLRHGDAFNIGEGGYSSDCARPLTPQGEREMREIAGGMKALGLSFDLILTSPYVRALQTAEIVSRVFGYEDRLQTTSNLTVGADPEDLITEIKKNSPSIKSVLLVGHEPSLSNLISMMVAGNSSLSIVMKKGALCKITADLLIFGCCASLDWLLTPDQLIELS